MKIEYVETKSRWILKIEGDTGAGGDVFRLCKNAIAELESTLEALPSYEGGISKTPAGVTVKLQLR